jgi:hypothetical protein
MVFRGRHYCTNTQFVSNFKSLFLNDCPELIEHPLVHSTDLIDCQTAIKRMEAFVQYITQMNVEEAVMKQRLCLIETRRRLRSSTTAIPRKGSKPDLSRHSSKEDDLIVSSTFGKKRIKIAKKANKAS